MSHKQSLIMPLEDADPRLFGTAAERASASAVGQNTARSHHTESPHASALAQTAAAASSSPAASPSSLGVNGGGLASGAGAGASSYVSEASLDFQRTLLQQQLQQGQREMERLKRELQEANGRLADTRQQLNEQKAAHTSLSLRYSTAVERLTMVEGDMRKLEAQLVQERNQRHQVQSEREEQRLALRELQWAHERLQRQLEQLEANKGLDPKEVQRALEDRSQYIPTVEVHRMQTEMQNTHQSLVDRLLTALESLVVSSEESQTNFFVARSAVLSAATDVSARLQRAEAALEDVDQQRMSYNEGLEKETDEFLLAVMSENKDLWQQLTLLQNEYDMAVAEVRLRSSQGGSVTAEEHAYAQRQLEVMTERLGKAQQLVESQTILARAHEEEMAELLEANDAMQRRLEEQQGTVANKDAALTEADAALRDATSQIEELQDALREERQRAAAMAAEMKATQRTMQDEYDARVRQLEHDCGVADDTAATLQHTLDETAAKLDIVERNLAARSRDFDAFKQQTQQQAAEKSARYRDEQQRVQAAMEEELNALRAQLDEAQAAARAAARQHDDAAAREGAAAVASQAAAQEVARLHDEVDAALRQLRAEQELRQRAQDEVEELRGSHDEGRTLATELQRRNELLTKEKAEVTEALAAEKSRQEQRYTALHTDWRTAEKARASLQEEVKTLRTRCGELETANMTQERQTQDKEQLMRENLRLHEQYQLIQRECAALREDAKALKQRGEDDAQWMRQVEELQRRLRELPELRQAADAARRDALTAKEETELLRRERDQLTQKLDTFLEDAKVQARREDDFERVCREASAAAQRVGGMVSSAKESSTRYHVFRNTNPTGRALSTSAGGGGSAAATPSAVVGSGSPRVSTTAVGGGLTSSSPSLGRAAPAGAAVQHRSPVGSMHNNNVISGGTPSNSVAGQSPRAGDPEISVVRSSTSSPSRPWH
ncbi:hypothetical protein ABB37_06225 [Leptomonas pyrrhocoris]|uniref:Uncharacterized protein n=1 Tax=Leptomonas pyrrhocoris TaxID=157538 RepID=A0A0M9FYD1_LEPPY|nr:hypothetical protein ABB37_06225 [Leptomonas pyrrhocoris]KPA78625.1 hypothetical protein ABB37_06225 [Leptomonas pyrrhocoris]|eukprot:XP_015657064.1 hypothetical protein ABB37_06225 [Leptomonas pyrrhocoris]